MSGMDREKVIKRAERIMCSTVDRDMIDSFCEDVIALLKEQEAVEPSFNKIMKHFVCPNCSLVLDEGRDDYCPSCGKEIAWDEYYIHEDD